MRDLEGGESDIDTLRGRLTDEVIDKAVIVNFKDQGLKLDDVEYVAPICAALADKPDVTVFCLQGNTLGEEGSRLISESFKECPKLERLLCEDIFTGRNKKEIPGCLKSLTSGLILSRCQLVELDFSGNAFGELAINAMFDLLTSETCFSLKELKFHNTGLGTSGGSRLAQALLKCLENSNDTFRLEKFVCGRSRLEDVGMKALSKFFSKCPDLAELVIPQNGIFKEGMVALGEALLHCPKFRHLNINDNILSSDGASKFGMFLASMKNLEHLDVGDCVLKSEGAAYIADAIKDLLEIRELRMDHNEIEIDVGLQIVEAVSNKKHLVLLSLDGNSFDSEGIAAIEERMRELGMLDALGAFSEDDFDEEERETDTLCFDDFAANPKLETLLLLENPKERATAYLNNFQCLDHVGLLRMAMKFAGCTDSSDQAVQIATECCEPALQQVFQMKYDSNTLTNLLAIFLGFVKDETKVIKAPRDITGLLLVLANLKRIFPADIWSALQTFVANMDPTKCSRTSLPKVLAAYK